MSEHIPAVVLSNVKIARAHLMHGQFRLASYGFECAALDDLHSDAAALLSAWQGRKPASNDTLPAYFAEAAIEYRRERDRRYRYNRRAA